MGKPPDWVWWVGALAAFAVAAAYAGAGQAKVQAQVEFGSAGTHCGPLAPDEVLMPHYMPREWDRKGRHSKPYPAEVGPNINALMRGAPVSMGMGLTSWMLAPPSEEMA